MNSAEPVATNRADAVRSTGGGRKPVYLCIAFALLCAVPSVFVWSAVRSFLSLVFQNDTFAYIPLIPLVSIYLIYIDRKAIFSTTSYDWVAASALLGPGALCLVLTRIKLWEPGAINQISLLMLGFVLIWMGAFALFFGARSFRAASFPLLFLVFTIPIPEPALSQIVFFLQEGSAKVAEWIFTLIGVPFVRQDLIFQLPGVAIRVAEECSGIRSTLALLITTVLASYFFLRSLRNRVVVSLFVIPMALLKNGLRIATLSTLAIYVDPGFLHGNLHMRGGVVFFMIALVPIGLLLLLLRRREAPKPVRLSNARASI
jgi:exosortase